MKRARFAISLALGALLAPSALATEITLQASKDNTIFEDSTFSNGAGSYFFAGVIGSNGSFKKRRALLAFDVQSAVPAGATVDFVSLDLYLSKNFNSNTLALHRLLADWGEAGSNTFGSGVGAPAQPGDATWDFRFFDPIGSAPWDNRGGDFVASPSATHGFSNTDTLYTIDSAANPQMLQDVQKWLSEGNAFGWLIKSDDETQLQNAQRINSRENTDDAEPIRPTLTISFSLPTPQWNIDADGSWGVAGNWSSNAVPDGSTGVANFLGKITAPRTITLDGSRVVAEVNFESSNKYTIAAGTGGMLVMRGAANQANITVAPGTHEISAKVAMVSPNVTINVAGDGKLILSGGMDISSGSTVKMIGGGDLILQGPQSHDAGAALLVSTTRLTMNSNAGTPAIASTAAVANLNVTIDGQSGMNPSLITLNASQDLAALNITFTDNGPQALDLNSTASEFHAVRIYSGDLDASKSTLAAAIKNGTIIGDDGLIDSGLHPGAAIGIARLTDVHGDDYILIRPTRIGDLNLDGSVTISDFIDLASHFNGTGDWQSGDLNGDGVVTISDFIDLASNFNGSYAGETFAISAEDQTALNAFAAAHGVSLVPEPASISILLIGMNVLRRRRR